MFEDNAIHKKTHSSFLPRIDFYLYNYIKHGLSIIPVA